MESVLKGFMNSVWGNTANTPLNGSIGKNDDGYNRGQLDGRSLVRTQCNPECIIETPDDLQQKLRSLDLRECAYGQSTLPLIRPDMTTAIQKGNTELLNYLISTRPGRPALNSALHEAAKRGQLHCLEILTAAGANNLDDALRTAAGQGHILCLSRLIQMGAKDLNGALREAAGQDQTWCLKPLINLINKGAKDLDLDGALCTAAKLGKKQSLLLLIKEGAKDLNGALYPAFLANNNEILNALIVNGADITSLVHSAAKTDSMEYLNDRVISTYINATDENGRTPLHIAAVMGHIKSLDKLLKTKGVNINIADKSGLTALHLAVQHNRTEAVMRLLTTDGINVNKKDKNRWTALHFAVKYANINIVRKLLNTDGIKLNEWVGFFNNTAILLAVKQGRADVVKELRAVKGTNFNQMNFNGDTALHLAARQGDAKIVRELLNVVGIRVKAKNKNGATPLSLADPDSECKELIKAFLKRK